MKALCLCSPCERARFARWRKRCEILAKDPLVLNPLSGTATDEKRLERETDRLFVAVFARLQGANPHGMTRRIVQAAAAIDYHRFEQAASDLADLEEDETQSLALNPHLRRCPRKGARRG